MSEGSDSDWGIYIGNIPHSLTKKHIESLFRKYNIVHAGGIHCNGIKMFCFLKLDKEADVINAVAQMNNYNINGRKLQVRQLHKRHIPFKPQKKFNSDDTALTVTDIPPPLETPSKNQNSNINLCTSTYQQSKACCSSDKFQTSGVGCQSSSSSISSLNSHVSSQAPDCCHQNPSFSSIQQISPQTSTHNSNHEESFPQLNKTLNLSSVTDNALNSSRDQNTLISPQNQNKLVRPVGQSKRLSSLSQIVPSSQVTESTLSSANLDHCSSESSEKYRYVHCTRNVISYNPREFENNKICHNPREPLLLEPVNVWAANFPYGTTKNQILKLFEDFSPLNAYINNNAPGGDFTRATVTLPSLEVAEAAIMELDNTIYKRRSLLVGLEENNFADDYNDKEDYDGNYCEPYSEHSNQGHYNKEQFCSKEPVSRRLRNIHIC